MLERDLERASAVNLEVSQINECIEMHLNFGKFLEVAFNLPRTEKMKNGEERVVYDLSMVSFALQINNDELLSRVNILINEILKEKLQAKRQELRKLGIKLEDETTLPALPKRNKKEPLMIKGPNGK